MGGNQYDDGEEEAAEAQDRINRILGGGGAAGGAPQSVGNESDPLGGTDPLAGRQFRSRAARATLEDDQGAQQGPIALGRAQGQPSARGRQALIVMLGILALGVVVVAAIFLLGSVTQGGGQINLPFFPTATPTATATPLPTLTPTATKVAPNLQLPQLTCIFTSDGCVNYCKDAANAAECQGAKDFVKAQGADPDIWFQCIAPASGPGGEAKKCLEDAWRAKNP